MTIISKKYEFDAGHRLSKGYVGKCANIHGHRYTVEVVLVGQLNKFDMVVDFNDLAPLKKWLDERFDHKLLLYVDDPLVRHEHFWTVLDACGIPRDAVVLMQENPTAEHIADVILMHARTQFSWGHLVQAVGVWETPTGMATAALPPKKSLA